MRGQSRDKAEKKLEGRVKAYEETCRTDSAGGKGFTKPGSMNGRKG